MAALPRSLAKLSRKARAAKKAAQKGFVWGEKPVSPFLGYRVIPDKHDKLVKIWDERPLPDEVQALLSVIGPDRIRIWWDPVGNGWGYCQPAARFLRSRIHPVMPFNASFRRWQHELSLVLDEPRITDPEW